MHRFIYKFSAFAAIITLVSALVNGVSIPTTVLRAALVFLGTLFLFIVFLNIMRWAIVSTTIIEQNVDEEDEDKTTREELAKQMEASTNQTAGANHLTGKTE